MLTKEQRLQAIKLQDTIGEIIDAYLSEGMDIDRIRAVLCDEMNSDLETRRQEIEAAKAPCSEFNHSYSGPSARRS